MPSAHLGIVGCASPLLSATELERPQPPPRVGAVSFRRSLSGTGRIRPLAISKHWLLKLNLMVSADREPTSASRIWRSSESPTADCHHPKLNGTVFGMHYWPECLRGQAATYRKLAEETDDPVVKKNLLELTSVCEEVANSIEDHLTGG